MRARNSELEEALLAGDRAVADLEARLAAALLDGAARGAAGLALRLALEAAASSVEAEAVQHAECVLRARARARFSTKRR